MAGSIKPFRNIDSYLPMDEVSLRSRLLSLSARFQMLRIVNKHGKIKGRIS